MTDTLSLVLAHRVQIGSSYMRLVGGHAGTTVPVSVHIRRDDSGTADYTTEDGVDRVTLHVSGKDFRKLGDCQIPTPPGEVHLVSLEPGKTATKAEVILYEYGPGEVCFPPKDSGAVGKQAGTEHEHKHKHEHDSNS